MSELRPTILKIGGSVITDKTGELLARTGEIDRVAEEIQNANIHNLIIVHGGGSFGHPSAQRYLIKEGYKEDSQKIGFSETHHFMTLLNGILMDSLIRHNVLAVSITPSSCLMTENGRITHFEDAPVKTLLHMGFTPVLYGDAVLDKKLGFTIVSGDQIAAVLAAKFNASRIIMGVDVDGLYDADPKTEKTAKMFRHLTLEELKRLESRFGKPTACDITGGMFGKMSELLPAIEQKIPVTIVNATKPSYLFNVLKGNAVESTTIQKG